MEKKELIVPTFQESDSRNLFLASRHGLRTYKELSQYADFFLARLQEYDADLSRPVGFLVESCDELVLAIASCWKLGIPFTCFDPHATATELQEQVERLKPGLLITDHAEASSFGPTETLSVQKIAVEKAYDRNKKASSSTFEGKTDPDDVFGYFFTSGTSSTPKVVPLKRRQMIFAAAASAGNFRPGPNRFWLLCLPLNHIGGISIILRSLLYGSGIYRMNNFDKEMVVTFLSENKLFQAASLVPTMLKRLIDITAFRTHKDFKAILLGGGPIDSSLLEESVKKGIPVVASYGMTETCAQIAANPFMQPSGIYRPLKSVGDMFEPNAVEIRDENGRALGTNNSGTIWLKGPQVFDGYLDTELNEAIFDEDGWFNTGDFGHLNVNRQLFIESRRSDLIITGGENVSPYEVESELTKIDPIQDAAVLGLSDSEWGQRVVAAVVAKNGSSIQQDEVKEKLKSRLTAFKIPKEIIQVDTLPKNRTGKVVRHKLSELFVK
ncbi:AMP-binding protein [Aliifodinibius sp. S!AR15-10]|uniref:AMP-binding protein n=1 Tax=Aliifodinibius sp. S!AR15-10 TaxID=2950437 RepID=UPI00285B3D08|nr:AMP-binding protein [Aliifodinibius sp. S!AR15-10]MDR8391107.1 AMP-binding protein [Aliifodinibius sp. S!AR15-10]